MSYPGILAFAISLIFSAPALADIPVDAVSRFVRAEMQRQHIPGLTLLVSRNGTPLRAEGTACPMWS